ncbi:MAG: carbamoyltransferase [Magnetovibrionaceae bacterium]
MLFAGLHNTGTISSAALVADGKLVAAMAEERLDRRKHSKYFPHRALQGCLDLVGKTLSDVDTFAIGWNPALNIAERYRAGFSEWPAYPGERFYANPNQLLPRLQPEGLVATDQVFQQADGGCVTLTYVNHHLCHAANAFYLSGLKEAAIFCCDGYGERSTTLWGTAGPEGIETRRTIEFPHSIGAFYSAITEFLGYAPDGDEWKIMGAAAYGDPSPFRAAMAELIRPEEDGGFSLALDYFDHFNFDSRGFFSEKVTDVLGKPPEGPEDDRFFDLAAAAQERLEAILFHCLTHARETTGATALCYAGGVAMNSLFNGKLTASGLFDDVFIPFSPDDSGNALGAALWAANRAGEPVAMKRRDLTSFLGRAFDDKEIKAALDRTGLAYETLQDPASTAADLLADGQVVGWFQGRSEFGQRALGARSILADPRNPETKDRVNLAIKYREAFRPFAPSVPVEDAERFFELPPGASVPFMERVFPVREAARSALPAIVHADGTARLQTVSEETQPLYHRLLKRVEEKTGFPVVLNTSFNLNGEPIVDAPEDAIRTFMTSGMNSLIMGHQLLRKA